MKVRTGVLIPGLARGLIKLNECKRPGDQFLHGGLTTVSVRGTQNRVRNQGERWGSNFLRASKGDTQKQNEVNMRGGIDFCISEGDTQKWA